MIEDICTDITIVTLAWGNENTWTFGDCKSSHKYNWDAVYTEECCQPEGTYELDCTDSYGDGWHGGYIEIGGTKYCESFTTGYEQNHDVAMPGKLKFRNLFSVTTLINLL